MKKSVAFASVWLASTGLSIPLGAGGTSQPLVATSDEQSGLNLLTGNTRVEFERLFGTEKVRAKDDPSLPPAAGSSAKTVEDTEREAPPDIVKQARNFDNHVRMNAKKLPPHLQQKYLDRFVTVLLRDKEGKFRIVFKDNATGESLAGDKLRNWQKWTLDQVKGDNTDPGSRPSNQKQAATASTSSVPQATSSRWKEPDSSKCPDNKSRSEDCLGTQIFCELGASRVEDKAKREKVQKDCEASRGGRPSAATTTGGSSTASVKLPWKDPGPMDHECGSFAWSEDECGTEFFCNQYFNAGKTPYETKEACFADRQPRPHKN